MTENEFMYTEVFKNKYKFKNNKHSVVMRVIKITDQFPDGTILLENADYPGLFYTVKSMDELEEVKWVNTLEQKETLL